MNWIGFVGDSLIDVEKKKTKAKANGASTVLNRTKKRQAKSNVDVAWGKLLSQCPQVGILTESWFIYKLKYQTNIPEFSNFF